MFAAANQLISNELLIELCISEQCMEGELAAVCISSCLFNPVQTSQFTLENSYSMFSSCTVVPKIGDESLAPTIVDGLAWFGA